MSFLSFLPCRRTQVRGARSVLLGGLLAGMLALLVACNEKPAATQLAARVDGSEISIHQVNRSLANGGATTAGLAPERQAGARRDVLERLVEQQLAVDRALAAKLDRQPDVMMEIEASRREILARSYYRQLVANLAEPTQAEARRYYAEHPQLFARRRIYKLREIVVPEREISADNLRVAVANRSMDEIEAWLTERKINHSGSAGARAAEQMPFDVLAELEQFKDGHIGVIETPNSLLVVHLLSSQAMPVDETAAVPVILRYLRNRQVLDTVTADNSRLRKAARIEYFNEFAQAGAGPAAGGTAAANAGGSAPESAAPARPAPGSAAGASGASGATGAAPNASLAPAIDPAAAVSDAVGQGGSSIDPSSLTQGKLRLP